MINDTDFLSPLNQEHLHSTTSHHHHNHYHHHASSSSQEEVSAPTLNHTSLSSSSSFSLSSPESLSMLEDFLAFEPLLVCPYSTLENPCTQIQYNPHNFSSFATHNLFQHYIYPDADELPDINCRISPNTLVSNPSQPLHESCNSLINATNSSSFYPSSCWLHPCCDLIPEEPHFLNGYSGLEHRPSLLERYSDELAIKSNITAKYSGDPFLRHYVSEKECEPLSKRFCSSTRKGREYNAAFDFDETGSQNIPIAQQNSSETCIEKPRSMQGCASIPQCTTARNRRERIRARMNILRSLVPSAYKMDSVTMLEKAIIYVKHLQMQIKVLSDDEYWPSSLKNIHMQSHIKPQLNDIIHHEESITSTNIKETL